MDFLSAYSKYWYCMLNTQSLPSCGFIPVLQLSYHLSLCNPDTDSIHKWITEIEIGEITYFSRVFMFKSMEDDVSLAGDMGII
jgi:hypothetical protein